MWFPIPLCLLLVAGVARGDVIAQLFEWRFDDIAEECRTFLPHHGYSAVQTSPVNEYAVLPGRPWYERYQPFSYRIVSRSGDEAAFKEMVRTCNSVGVRVFVDVILNHMSASLAGGTVGSGGSKPDTGAYLYPDVPYGPGDFHQRCSIDDWNNPWKIRNCELLGLHDLNQTSPYVRGKMVEFLNHLVDIGVSGFRVDAAKHIAPDDLAAIMSQVKNLNQEWFPANTRPFIYQEIADFQDAGVVNPREYFGIGSTMDFKYGYELSRAFKNQNQLKWFKTFGEKWGLLPWNKSVVFIDNHDTQRDNPDILTYKQSKLYKMATGFMLSWPHSASRVMSSFSFQERNSGPPSTANGEISRVVRNQDLSCAGGWVCEHRWRQIYAMVTFAEIVKGTAVREWWDNGNYQISFCRGDRGFVAFNADSNQLDAELQTCLPAGVYCDVVSGLRAGNSCSGRTVTVNEGGKARIVLPNDGDDGFLAIHVQSRIR